MTGKGHACARATCLQSLIAVCPAKNMLYSVIKTLADALARVSRSVRKKHAAGTAGKKVAPRGAAQQDMDGTLENSIAHLQVRALRCHAWQIACQASFWPVPKHCSPY